MRTTVSALLLAISLSGVPLLCSAAEVGTAFTYQGELRRHGAPASGNYDIEARLFADPDGLVQVGPVVQRSGVVARDGLFATELDFGTVFNEQALWLELRVRPTGEAFFELLQPRQRVTAAPLALRAQQALVADGAVQASQAPWAGVTNKPAGFADNDDADALGKLVCGPGQVPTFASGAWSCATPAQGTVTGIATGSGLQGGPINQSGTISVAPLGITLAHLDANSVDASKVIDGSLTLADVNATSIQARVEQGCAAGTFLQGIAANGSVTCAAAPAAVTRVDAGAGLNGGPITGTGTLSIAPLGVTGAMLAEGTITGAKVQDGSLTVADLDASVQRRVSGTCALGSIISAINADGSVSCQPMALPPRVMDIPVPTWGGSHSMDVSQGPQGWPRIVNADSSASFNYARCNNEACTSLPVVSYINAGGAYPNLHVRQDDLPLISYSVSNGGIRLMVCSDADCQNKVVRTISAPSGSDQVNSYYHAMAIGPNGPVFTYRNYTTNALYVRRCLDETCASLGPQSLVSGVNGLIPGIALRANGFPVVVSTDSNELEFTSCDDADCTSFTTGSSVRGLWGVATVPDDNRPIAASVSADNAKIHYYRCATENCSTVASKVLFDAGTPVEPRVDLFLDVDGLPSVVYAISNRIYLSHCSDMNCTTATHTLTGASAHTAFAAMKSSLGTGFTAGRGSNTPISTAQCYSATCE